MSKIDLFPTKFRSITFEMICFFSKLLHLLCGIEQKMPIYAMIMGHVNRMHLDNDLRHLKGKGFPILNSRRSSGV